MDLSTRHARKPAAAAPPSQHLVHEDSSLREEVDAAFLALEQLPQFARMAPDRAPRRMLNMLNGAQVFVGRSSVHHDRPALCIEWSLDGSTTNITALTSQYGLSKYLDLMRLQAASLAAFPLRSMHGREPS